MNYIDYLKAFIPLDKMYIDILEEEYHSELLWLGRIVYNRRPQTCLRREAYFEELLDFIDGNGFEITYDADGIQFPVIITPIYTPEWEEFVENERAEQYRKIREAIEKVESAVAKIVPVQDEVLSYTSVEGDERPLLECEELFAPRPIRLRIRRCLEFLRLVSAGWGRGTALPRPP